MPTSTLSASEWPDSSTDNKAMIWPNLLAIAKSPERFSWQPFRPGVEIYHLYGDGQQGGSAAALLKYEPGASVPEHEHTGYEHIIVLSGAQQDHQGTHTSGTLVINPPGSGHTVASDEGCIVLIIWEKPVRMKEADGRTAQVSTIGDLKD